MQDEYRNDQNDDMPTLIGYQAVSDFARDELGVGKLSSRWVRSQSEGLNPALRSGVLGGRKAYAPAEVRRWLAACAVGGR